MFRMQRKLNNIHIVRKFRIREDTSTFIQIEVH